MLGCTAARRSAMLGWTHSMRFYQPFLHSPDVKSELLAASYKYFYLPSSFLFPFFFSLHRTA
jgi:hypothetical protein